MAAEQKNRLRVYDSQSRDYQEAFELFLKHTDQKVVFKKKLNQLINLLPCRRVFIDAGAGTGQITSWFTERFQRTVAIEPNAFLHQPLRKNSPEVELIDKPILVAKPERSADLVLCSHVFYHINQDEWMANLKQLGSWLSSKGMLIMLLQNRETDCMRMLEHFLGSRFDLPGLVRSFQQEMRGNYRVEIETVPAYITTEDLEAAYTIAEFILNDQPMPLPPLRGAVEAYLQKNFRQPKGGYRFSCHQDFIQIRRMQQPAAEAETTTAPTFLA